ncbi:MAG: hypothetical protein GX587_01890 [Bacteroidales bacterium]|nr:hypothetical protein [Bacteroidales bacterium]
MKKFFSILGALMFFFLTFYFLDLKHSKEMNELDKRFPLLSISDSLKGCVSWKYDFEANHSREPGSLSYIDVGSAKFQIYADGVGAFSDFGINQVVFVGDSIFKEKGNDTIFVKKKSTGELYILLRRDVLYP